MRITLLVFLFLFTFAVNPLLPVAAPIFAQHSPVHPSQNPFLAHPPAAHKESVEHPVSPPAPALGLTLAVDPKEYSLGQTLRGGVMVTNTTATAVSVSFLVELLQANTLKWQRNIPPISIAPGTHQFALADVFGSPPMIPPDRNELIGTWKLKIRQLGAQPEASAEASFQITKISDKASITVDATEEQGPVKLLSGICCNGPHPLIPDSLLVPLKLPFWRFAVNRQRSGEYERLMKFNDKTVLSDILSDAFMITQAETAFRTDLSKKSYARNFIDTAWEMAILYRQYNDARVQKYLQGLTPEQRQDVTAAFTLGTTTLKTATPWNNNWEKWDRFIFERVSRAKREGKRIRYWDVLNEPTSQDFWPDLTKELFFETYKIAYQAIKRADSSAWVGGPSLGVYDKGYILEFLQYIKKNNIGIDFLIWHSLELVPGDDLENISAQMAEMRNIVANQFPTLGIREYHMNEVIGANNVHSPGATLASLVFLEAGNVDYAARATWTSDPLNGLLVDFKTPRPVWWAYKVYADTFPGVRIRTTSPDPSIVGLASRDPDGRLLRILVGHYVKRGEPSPPREVTLRVANLSFRTPSVSVELQKIPGSPDPLPAGPIGVFKKTLPIANRGLTVDIGQVAKDDVYVVLIGSP